MKTKFHTLITGVLLSTLAIGVYANERAITIEVTGKISQRCNLQTVDSELEFKSGSQGSLVSTRLQINCNMPMAIDMRSDFGGMKRMSDDISNTDLKPYEYQAEFNIDTLGFSRTVSSKELKDGVRYSTAPDIPFSTQGVLNVTMMESIMFAGEYRDVIRIEVSPDLGADANQLES